MLLKKELEKYILDHIQPEDGILKELDRETNLKFLQPRMISGHYQGQLLILFSRMIKPKKILEIGTFTGYSAICLAQGLQRNGKLFTIERNDELETTAKKYFEKAGISDRIHMIFGDAIKQIPLLKEKFDLVFIDADKREYCNYYNLVYDKIPSGGYIIADNTLWNGKVIEKISGEDDQAKGIIEFNRLIKNDNRVEQVILPVRDGMTIIRKK